ncbi:MAG: synthase subunit gamma [Gammaproteobacteria bacterium]|jgi:F-type H+-transporting ATPase subunit gamma|nr:synthase subunit gamma [Gammaproteobacteria bacterium]
MSSAKEIRSQIKSIRKTKTITRAMEMVAASKMRKAQQRMLTSRPYSRKVREVIGHLAKAHSEYRDLYLELREEKRIGYIVVTSDRGLCGGLNANLIRRVQTHMNEKKQNHAVLDLCLVGHKAIGAFRQSGANIIATAEHMGDAPSVNQIIGIVKIMLDRFREREIDSIYVAYNDFINTMSQTPQIERLLPLVPVDEDKLNFYWDYIYEPDPKEVLDALTSRYIESQVYQAVIENIACEQAARMVAMKNATDNANNLIDELQLVYNKARQASITQELSEIVGGADAVS